MAAGTSGDAFSKFITEVKEIEKRDSKLTPSQQIDRLLRPGSSYFNLNPFEVLQLDPEATLEIAKKQYKKMSLLIHPDKNPDDRERADKAFAIVKGALAQMEDPDELSRCRDIFTEAKARTDIMIGEKRRALKKENKVPAVEEDDPEKYKRAVWVLTNKLFADRERKKRALEERANNEKKRQAEEACEVAEKKKMDEEYQKNYEESRDDRVGSWKNFQKKEEKKKGKKKMKIFKPPKPMLDRGTK